MVLVVLGNLPNQLTGFGRLCYSIASTLPLFSALESLSVMLYSLKPFSKIELLIAKRMFQIWQVFPRISTFKQTLQLWEENGWSYFFMILLTIAYLIIFGIYPTRTWFSERWLDCRFHFPLFFYITKYRNIFPFLFSCYSVIRLP